jgi:hypothetical protein
MKYSKWIGLSGSILLITACTMPWVYILSKSITVTGLHAAGTNYGKPGLMNIVMCGLAIVFFLLPKVWAKRGNLFVCAFNAAWAVRNYILVSACYMGECPVKQTGLFLLLIAAVIMLLAALFPNMELATTNEDRKGS